MERTIFLVTLGAFLSSVAIVGGFHLSFWLFYSSHHAEDVSSVLLIAIVVTAIVLGVCRRFRALGVGMVVGCVFGLLILGTSLWGA